MNIEKRIESLIAQMTLKEKISMCHGSEIFKTAGVERLGIPPLVFSDGPMGVRREFAGSSWDLVGWSNDFVSYLPSNMSLAASWNKALVYECGRVLGREARGRGKDVILAPGVNIIRTPLGGRNFEYFSEDPFLTAEMAVSQIEGIQKEDVAACIKHFAANNHEENRLAVDIDMDERTLREIYLPAFKAAVQTGNVLTIMAAYNRFRGDFCSESPELLKDILRKEWGFDGVVVSDWGAVHHTDKAAESGVDIEMDVKTEFDQYHLADPFQKAIEAGKLGEDSLNEKVRNILRLMFRLNMFSSTRKKGTYNRIDHWTILQEGARESVVLLKNEKKRLPLDRNKIKKLLVIGENADRIHSNGGGSAEIKALFEMSPLMGLSMIGGGNLEIQYCPGYSSGVDLSEEDRNSLRVKALESADEADAVIVFCGLNHEHDREEFDRVEFVLPYGQNRLIEEILDKRPDSILVNLSGSPVGMPWIKKADTLLQLFYSGMFTGQAVAEVIFGDINPSGKLPVSFPVKLEDVPAHAGGARPEGDSIYYDEGLMVGYRHYDTQGIKPLLPFGHGLSYSDFEYSEILVDRSPETPACTTFSIEIKNISSVSGSQTLQLYWEKPDSVIVREKKSLKGFHKIFLVAGESACVNFKLDDKSLSYYDEESRNWKVEPGEYLIHLGISSQEIIRTECIDINS